MNLQRSHRILEDLKALGVLSQRCRRITFNISSLGLLLQYTDTPGLVETANNRGISVWTTWDVRVLLGPQYPIDSPVVLIRPHQCSGRPLHPNITPEPPYRLCYGRHLPTLLADELALRVERMVRLCPEAIMTDERNALNTRACQIVRRLIRENYTPLRDTSLPTWCRVEDRMEGKP